jgi:prepilin-type N-terminal cleavage/methylation domain-containing protein
MNTGEGGPIPQAGQGAKKIADGSFRFSAKSRCTISAARSNATSPKETRVPRERNRGFTLIELLVVVVVTIGLLAGFVAPRYFCQVAKYEVNVAKPHTRWRTRSTNVDSGHYP